MKHFQQKKRIQLGPVAQKTLLLLAGGCRLALTRRPDTSFRILKDIAKEWKKIHQRGLRKSIRRLYQSKLIHYEEHADGTVSMVLTVEGEKRALRYKVNEMKIKKPSAWDGLWRMVIFDIPEKKKQGRVALAAKLRHLGFYPLQKSVFVYPYECKDEIDFIVELFDLVPYVRFIHAKGIDAAPHLKHHFNL